MICQIVAIIYMFLRIIGAKLCSYSPKFTQIPAHGGAIGPRRMAEQSEAATNTPNLQSLGYLETIAVSFTPKNAENPRFTPRVWGLTPSKSKDGTDCDHEKIECECHVFPFLEVGAACAAPLVHFFTW